MYEQGTTVPITFPLHMMKPPGARWIKDFHTYLAQRPDIIRNGFRATGIIS